MKRHVCLESHVGLDMQIFGIHRANASQNPLSAEVLTLLEWELAGGGFKLPWSVITNTAYRVQSKLDSHTRTLI